MGVYYQPPPPFMGGGPPRVAREHAPAVTAVRVDDPPFKRGGPVAVLASVVASNWPSWSVFAWPYVFVSQSGQPYGERQLTPGIPGQSIHNPPFSLGGPYALKALATAIAQPDPWTYSFMGDRQPFGPKRRSSAIPGQSINDPPFTLGGPYALKALAVAIAQPNPWTFTFLGSSQPFGPKRRSSAIPGQSADPPPFTLGGPYALKLEAVAVNQPAWSYTAWPYVFMGNRQPYAPRVIPAGFAAVTVSPFPFSHRGRTAALLAIRAAWNPPPPDFQMQLYATRPSPQRLRPSARGYIIL
jgi:hypothetical protein